MEKQDKIAVHIPIRPNRVAKEYDQMKNEDGIILQNRMNKQNRNGQACKQTDRLVHKNKQTIIQLFPKGTSCSANSGVGLSGSQSRRGNSHLPNECSGAATITNYLLPKCSPWNTLESQYQLCLVFSGTIGKIRFAMATYLSSFIGQKAFRGKNREDLLMG